MRSICCVLDMKSLLKSRTKKELMRFMAMTIINRETLSAIRMPVPPLQEQERIIFEIRKGTERIDLQRKAIRVSVELLKERRAALITAAVTGQIPLEEMTG